MNNNEEQCMKVVVVVGRTTFTCPARRGVRLHWVIGLAIVALWQSAAVPVAISANGASTEETSSVTEGDSKKDTSDADAPITVPPIVVQGQRMGPEGTGTLNLQEQSSGSSRLGLTLREIPASVEVITQQTMEERGLRTVSEAIQAATGVTVNDIGINPGAFSMRGFANNQIRLLFDGLSLGPTGFITRPHDSWNLERIEILKGPASVLYGEGAVAGMVNLVTKRPLRGVSGSEVFGSYGSYNTIRAGVGSGGRLWTDKLHYRVDVSYLNSDSALGVQHTPYTYWNITSGLLYDVTSRLNVEVSFDIAYDRAKPYWGTPLVPSSFATQGVSGIVSTPDGRTIDGRMIHQNYNVQDSDMSAWTTWTKLKATWTPTDFLQVRNQAYFYTAKRDWMNAETYTFNAPTQLVDRDRFLVQHDQYTVGNRLEFQINHPIGMFKNRFVSGFDFSYIDFTRPSFFSATGGSVDPFAPVAGLFGGGPAATQTAKILNTALFAEDQFSVTDTLKLVAGVRTEYINLKRDFFTATGALNPTQSFDHDFTPTTWRVGAVYDVLPHITFYGQYATAADPVGGSLFGLRNTQLFDLATGKQWEVGAKGQFWDNRAQWTLAYFDIVRKNILTQISQTESVNVGRQSSRGIEFDAALRVTDAWRVQGNVTFLEARFDEFSELSGGNLVSRNGNRPFEVPQTVANLWSIYRVPTSIPFDVGAAWRFVGDRYIDAANTIRLHGYMTADAWVSVPYKQFVVTLRARNLADKTYAYWGSTFYPDQLLVGAPRTFELSVMARF
jgi:iron complex outermembrane recepter protein